MIAMHINDEQLKAQTSTFKAGEKQEEEWRILQFGQGKGQLVHFKMASEPTDIIWENRCISDRERFWRMIGAYTVIFFLLSISFVATFLIARSSSQVAMVFPSRDCEGISKSYGD